MTTTTNQAVLHQRGRAYDYASMGAQASLVCVACPAGAEATILNKTLDGVTLSVNGDYVFLIPIAGLTSVKTNLRATLSSATVTSAGPDELAQFDPKVDSIENAVVITSGTGDGALSTGVLQTASLTPTGGLYARVTITVASAGTAAFTVAEMVGV